jgi:capsular polysaccharide biosynthesis protein
MPSNEKGVLSKGVRLVREQVKRGSAHLAAKTFGRRSYPLFGIPCGLTEVETKTLLYPTTTLGMKAPGTIEAALLPNFQALLDQVDLPAEGILTLQKGIATSKGGNLSEQGKLVTTFLQPIDGKPPHQHDLFRFSTKRFFPRIYRADGPVVTLAAGWQGAFYHWIFDVLTRLHLIEKGGHSLNRLYVEAAFDFQKESLELLGIQPSQMINAKDYAAVYAPQLIIPSVPPIPTEWGCQFLREKILPKLSSRSRLRLYVSRSEASRRRILNEEAVETMLRRYGFEKVILSSFRFKEQAELFYAADAVVGPHGAGFSHLVFCRPHTPVLEIFSPPYVNLCYWHVCNRVSLSYHYLFGEDLKVTGDPDIEVNLSKLEASLKLMGL